MNKSRASMKRLFIVAFIISIIPETTIANDFFGLGKTKKKTKEDYSHSRCLDTHTLHQANLTDEEICKYGLSCPPAKNENKITMYCLELNIGDCFKKSSWRSTNQLLRVSENKTIGIFTRSLSIKGGVRSEKVCAYFD